MLNTKCIIRYLVTNDEFESSNFITLFRDYGVITGSIYRL